MSDQRIDVDSPLWDQTNFYGRFRHFAWMTNPLNGLHMTKELEEAKTLVNQYRNGEEPAGTTPQQVKNAMKLFNSSFHPDSGELQNVFGRMSFQVPGGMLITGAMLQFYKSVPQVVFWQWFNQSFNALVNYTNRNANSPTSVTQLGVAYLSATFSALGTAIGLKKVLESRAPPMIQRFVPFAAVASANCVNIPLMRQNEISNGIELKDENGKVLTSSKAAAVTGISQVVLSRIIMAAPGMLVLPFLMRKMEAKPWFAKKPILHAPFQVAGVGAFLMFMVPLACSIFPQTVTLSSLDLEKLDKEAFKNLVEKCGGRDKIPQKLYFNKGL